MNIANQKRTHIYSKQTSNYQWGERRGVQDRVMGLGDTNYYV